MTDDVRHVINEECKADRLVLMGDLDSLPDVSFLQRVLKLIKHGQRKTTCRLEDDRPGANQRAEISGQTSAGQ